MNKVKFTIKFRLEQRKSADGQVIMENVPVIANITFCGKRLIYFTGQRINATQWCDDKEEVKRNNFNKAGESASEINARLRQIRTAVDVVFTRLAATDVIPTPNNVREMLKNELGKATISRKSFMEYYEQFINEAGTLRQWSKPTYKKYFTIRQHLQAYQRTSFYFEDVTKSFMRGFVEYLVNLGLRNDVVLKYIVQFNSFMTWATDEGHNKNLEYQHFKPTLKTTTDKIHKFALSEGELQMLFTMEINKPYLQRVRDVFCFCCATGLRYSDARALRWCDIKNGYIDFTTQKTSEHLQIPLTEMSNAIIARYESTKDVFEYVLPVISNQKYNKYLKELGQLAGMNETHHEVFFSGSERKEDTFQRWQKLSSHVARRTFVTLAVSRGIPGEVIRSMTGHHSTAVMDKYVKLNLAEKTQQMEKMNIGNDGQTSDELALMNRINQALAVGDLDAMRPAWDALCLLRGLRTANQ
mgnify:CR=1 FL=1